MISFFEASLEKLIVHNVGNKINEETLWHSDKPISLFDDRIEPLLKHYLLTPFTKTTKVYNLSHPSGDVKENTIWNIVTKIFDDESAFRKEDRFIHGDVFIEESQELASSLFEITDHPKIKGGEFYVASFKNVQIEGDLHDVIGLFKSETKDTYLKLWPNKSGYDIDYESKGINIDRLDKGCLIFNTDKENGYKVVIVDQAKGANAAAAYWKDEFLYLKARNDSYSQTSNIVNVFTSFVSDAIDNEFEVHPIEKGQLLNDAVKYFKEREQFDFAEFSHVVFGSQEQVIESFTNYKDNYTLEFEAEIPDTFNISENAVKTHLKAFKTVFKLDKNFHIYVHGNSELIEPGFDEERQMNYYKVYFKEQS